LLMSGGFGSLLTYQGFCLITILWELLIYYPLCHAVWGGGLFDVRRHDKHMYAKDFAGGLVIHYAAGLSALIAILYWRYRGKKCPKVENPAALNYAILGATLLWLGWFGFNGGSALSVGDDAINAVNNTQHGAAWCCLVWGLISVWETRNERKTKTRQSIILQNLANGLIAGLACITACSGVIHTWHCVLVGGIGGLASKLVSMKFRQWNHKELEGESRFVGFDDQLDVFSVHGVSGATGFLVGVGLFDTRGVQDVYTGAVSGGLFVSGKPDMLLNQIIVFAIVTVWISSMMLCILMLCTFLENFGFLALKVEKEAKVPYDAVSQDNFQLPVLSGVSNSNPKGKRVTKIYGESSPLIDDSKPNINNLRVDQ